MVLCATSQQKRKPASCARLRRVTWKTIKWVQTSQGPEVSSCCSSTIKQNTTESFWESWVDARWAWNWWGAQCRSSVRISQSIGSREEMVQENRGLSTCALTSVSPVTSVCQSASTTFPTKASRHHTTSHFLLYLNSTSARCWLWPNGVCLFTKQHTGTFRFLGVSVASVGLNDNEPGSQSPPLKGEPAYGVSWRSRMQNLGRPLIRWDFDSKMILPRIFLFFIICIFNKKCFRCVTICSHAVHILLIFSS